MIMPIIYTIAQKGPGQIELDDVYVKANVSYRGIKNNVITVRCTNGWVCAPPCSVHHKGQ